MNVCEKAADQATEHPDAPFRKEERSKKRVLLAVESNARQGTILKDGSEADVKDPPPQRKKIVSFRQKANKNHREVGGGEASTDFYGGDAEAAGLEDDADAAGRYPFPQPAHHSPRHQHVLHLSLSLALSISPDKKREPPNGSNSRGAESTTMV